MLAIKELNRWTNKFSKFYLFLILRITLGAFLFLKGVQFMSDIDGLMKLINPDGGLLLTMFVAHYVSMIHLAGGILIFFGLLTRISLLFQVPILIGAVAVNFLYVMNVSNLLIATLVLMLSILFILVGSGKHSLDHSFQMGA